MPHEDTPPDPVRAHRHPGGEVPAYADLVALVLESRRELQKEIRDARREQSDAMTEVRTRLGGIEGRLAEGSAMIRKHDDQIIELAGQVVDVEKRLDAIEDQRTRDDAVASERKNGMAKRLAGAFAIGAATALGPLAIGFVLWLLSQYVKAQQAAAAPAPAPIAAPAGHGG